jgi:chitinase
MTSSSSSPIKGGYISGNLIPLSTIKKDNFTHFYYAFVNPVKVERKGEEFFEFIKMDTKKAASLTEFNDNLKLWNIEKQVAKALVSIGGFDAGNTMFSPMASKKSLRRNFILSSIKLARDCGFKGIDLDWEFPQTCKDMENMGHLLDEWREEINKDGSCGCKLPLLLTAAVYYKSEIDLDDVTKLAYPVASMAKNLDWINVMTYDYHVWYKTTTGNDAALYGNNGKNTSAGLDSWNKAGIPKSKLMMGLPLYGRKVQLKDYKKHNVGADTFDKAKEELTYAQIVKHNRENGAKVVFNDETVSAYSVAGDSWIGYDDTETVKTKVKYAREQEIGGYFFWALHQDNKWEISTTASVAWPA